MILSEVCLPFPKEWIPEWPEPLAQLNELWKTKWYIFFNLALKFNLHQKLDFVKIVFHFQ
jgi:hypothetical protein